MTSRARWRSRLEYALVFLLVAGLCVHAGYRSADHNQVNWEGLAAVAHAHDVLYRAPEPRLSQIGFVEPPLGSLVAALFCLPRPYPAMTPYLPAHVGALLLGLLAVIYLALCRSLGLSRLPAYLLTALLVLHPVTLGLAAGGSPLTLLMLLALGVAWTLDRWGESASLRYLLLAGILLGLALLTRWEMVLWVLPAAGMVAWISRRAGGEGRAQGQTIAFLLPAAYLAGAWVLACWLIQGDPWYFWRHTFAAAGSAVPWGLFPRALYYALLCSPLLLGALWFVVGKREDRRRSPGSLLLTLGSLALIVPAAPLLARLPGDAWVQLATPLALLLPAGALLAARAWAGLSRAPWTQPRKLAALGLAVTGLLATVLLSGQGRGLPQGTLDALAGRLPFTGDCQTEHGVACLLRDGMRPGDRVLIAGWPGFAVALLEGDLWRMTLQPSPRPEPGRRYAANVVLVREQRRGETGVEWERALPGMRAAEVSFLGSWSWYRLVPAGPPPGFLPSSPGAGTAPPRPAGGSPAAGAGSAAPPRPAAGPPAP